MKKFIKYMFLILTIFFITSKSDYVLGVQNAINLENSNTTYKVETESETKIISVDEKITKKEVLTSQKYYYGEQIKDDDYKYISYKIEFIYYGLNNLPIAIGFLRTNFRYNKGLKESKCLSATSGRICISNMCKINLSCRVKNPSFCDGKAISKINFEYDGKNYYEIYNISCDCEGNITIT